MSATRPSSYKCEGLTKRLTRTKIDATVNTKGGRTFSGKVILEEIIRLILQGRINGLLLILDNTFEHKLSDRELLKRHIGSHSDNFPLPFRGVMPIETIYSYLAQIKLMLSANKNERFPVIP